LLAARHAIAPEDGSRASTRVMHQPPYKPWLKRTLQQLVGNPCPCSNSTRPSWPQTNLPSNLRTPPRNRMALQWAQWARLWHNRHLDSGSLFHELCNTTPSWPQTSPLANSQIHPGNCKDLLGVVAQLADRKCDDGCSTMSAWHHPRSGTFPLRNCMDQQVRAALWVEREAESGAESQVEFAAAWEVAWVVAWVAAWETEWVALSGWSPAMP